MTTQGRFLAIDPDECRRLLGSTGVGRVAWVAGGAVLILPVSYVFDGEQIVFRTSEGSILAELVRPVDVAFQIDDLDGGTATGWTVLVQATSGPADEATAARAMPWAPGERRIAIALTPRSFSGRLVSADH